jgi:hypothetical protein
MVEDQVDDAPGVIALALRASQIGHKAPPG